MNKVIEIGNLTRDAELKYTQSGVAISNFAIAVNEKVKKGEDWVDEVSYFDCTLFGKQAESLNQYLLKGKQVAVFGKLKQDRWEQDGQSRSKIVIIANEIKLLGSTNTSGSGNNSGSGGSSYQNKGGYEPPPAPEEIPF